MAKDLEQRFDSAMKKGEKQDRAKAATTAKYDKLRSGKGKQQQHNEAMTGNYAPKRQGTSDGYLVERGASIPRSREYIRNKNANPDKAS